MGMFDDITCKYPLPIQGANELDFQTKDTPAQMYDCYEIREDGTLWHQDYDIKDRSDPKAEGLMRICGMMSRVNQRWEKIDWTGELRFYTIVRDGEKRGRIEFMAVFFKGDIQELSVLEHREAA
jgi:hypothetical protein